jgi:hypothetical protein
MIRCLRVTSELKQVAVRENNSQIDHLLQTIHHPEYSRRHEMFLLEKKKEMKNYANN